MSRKQSEKPLSKILIARSKLEMATKHPELFGLDELRTIIPDAMFAVSTLMDFRNIVAAMSDLDETPKDAARPYLDD